jgi:hypothetical protein
MAAVRELRAASIGRCPVDKLMHMPKQRTVICHACKTKQRPEDALEPKLLRVVSHAYTVRRNIKLGAAFLAIVECLLLFCCFYFFCKGDSAKITFTQWLNLCAA